MLGVGPLMRTNMNRRAYIQGLGALATGWPLRAKAQAPSDMRTIGLWWFAAPDAAVELADYRKRLAQLGWVEDRNVRLEVRSWTGDAAAMRVQVNELLATRPDVIVVVSNPALAILRPVSGRIPVVFAMVADPVGSGFVESLARPGANITGFMNYDPAFGAKWLEVLKEAVPVMTRVLVLMQPETAAHKGFSKAIAEAAGPLRVEAQSAGVHDVVEIRKALAEFAGSGGGGVIALPHAVTVAHRELIIEQAIGHRMPTIFAIAADVSAGALVTYGVNRVALTLRTTEYVDRILRGANPADLPVQGPVTFELAVNLKTANALGLTVPSSLLARADTVIE
jgi:putative ABC transport system substrate-binding protein